MDDCNAKMDCAQAAVPAEAISCQTAPQRSGYQVADELNALAEKFAGPSHEHRLLREAVQLIFKLVNDEHAAISRAHCAEADADRARAQNQLARLALCA